MKMDDGKERKKERKKEEEEAHHLTRWMFIRVKK